MIILKSLVILFLETFAIVFVGFVLCNIGAVTIDGIHNGFDLFLGKLCDLPYLLYLAFSLIFSIIFVLIIHGKTKTK